MPNHLLHKKKALLFVHEGDGFVSFPLFSYNTSVSLAVLLISKSRLLGEAASQGMEEKSSCVKRCPLTQEPSHCFTAS